jgi:hypothetical protein
LYVLGATFSGLERFVFSHEFGHALVDQHYHLESIGVYPECLQETDRCTAITALIEGDASLLMYQWLETYGTEEDINEILSAQFNPSNRALSSEDLAPPYSVRDVQFKYDDGFQFVEYLHNQGGWGLVNLVYSDLPQTTEQILHPDKYMSKEGALPVAAPSLGEILDQDWRFLIADTLGELGTQMVLGYNANGLNQLDQQTTAQAAAGWGGDHYQVYYRGKTNHSILAAKWVWDTSADASEFWEAMRHYLQLRYGGKTAVHDLGLCWQRLNDHYTCIFQTEVETLWIQAPTMEMMNLIWDHYPAFH